MRNPLVFLSGSLFSFSAFAAPTAFEASCKKWTMPQAPYHYTFTSSNVQQPTDYKGMIILRERCDFGAINAVVDGDRSTYFNVDGIGADVVEELMQACRKDATSVKGDKAEGAIWRQKDGHMYLECEISKDR